MIARLSAWFLALSRRETVLIGILAVLLAGTIAFYGVYRPFVTAIQGAAIDYREAVDRQGRIESKVAALQEGSGGDTGEPAGVSGALDQFVSQSAGETGIAIGSVDPQADNRVTMTVQSAKPTALFSWLARIEQQGVSVESLNASPAGEGTITATMTLRKN